MRKDNYKAICFRRGHKGTHRLHAARATTIGPRQARPLNHQPPRHVARRSSNLFHRVLHEHYKRTCVTKVVRNRSRTVDSVRIDNALRQTSVQHVNSPIGTRRQDSHLSLRRLILLLITSRQFRYFISVTQVRTVVAFRRNMRQNHRVTYGRREGRVYQRVQPFRQGQPVFSVPRSHGIMSRQVLTQRSRRARIKGKDQNGRHLRCFQQGTRTLSSHSHQR